MLDQSKKMTPAPIQPSGRFQLVLSSSAPILLVVPDASSSSHETSIAVRIAHDLHKYHRIDTELITSAEALHRATNDTLDMGNLVIVGNARDVFTRWLLSDMPRRTPFEIDAEHFKLKGKRLASPGLGIVFLHPHHTSPEGVIAFVSGTDFTGMEKAARLFPIRTGVLVPDWLVIGNEADHIGASAVVGAGVWGTDWSWNNCTSWLD